MARYVNVCFFGRWKFCDIDLWRQALRQHFGTLHATSSYLKKMLIFYNSVILYTLCSVKFNTICKILFQSYRWRSIEVNIWCHKGWATVIVNTSKWILGDVTFIIPMNTSITLIIRVNTICEYLKWWILDNDESYHIVGALLNYLNLLSNVPICDTLIII